MQYEPAGKGRIGEIRQVDRTGQQGDRSSRFYNRSCAGRPYNNAEHNRMLQAAIGRSRGLIEFKHCNISAMLKGLGEGLAYTRLVQALAVGWSEGRRCDMRPFKPDVSSPTPRSPRSTRPPRARERWRHRRVPSGAIAHALRHA